MWVDVVIGCCRLTVLMLVGCSSVLLFSCLHRRGSLQKRQNRHKKRQHKPQTNKRDTRDAQISCIVNLLAQAFIARIRVVVGARDIHDFAARGVGAEAAVGAERVAYLGVDGAVVYVAVHDADLEGRAVFGV